LDDISAFQDVGAEPLQAVCMGLYRHVQTGIIALEIARQQALIICGEIGIRGTVGLYLPVEIPGGRTYLEVKENIIRTTDIPCFGFFFPCVGSGGDRFGIFLCFYSKDPGRKAAQHHQTKQKSNAATKEIGSKHREKLLSKNRLQRKWEPLLKNIADVMKLVKRANRRFPNYFNCKANQEDVRRLSADLQSSAGRVLRRYKAIYIP
jgi:hypothetical protein